MLRKAREPRFWIIVLTGVALFALGWVLYETTSKALGGVIATIGFGMGFAYPIGAIRYYGFVGTDDESGESEGDAGEGDFGGADFGGGDFGGGGDGGGG